MEQFWLNDLSAIKCRIPDTRPTYSLVNFTKEHVDQIFFFYIFLIH